MGQTDKVQTDRVQTDRVQTDRVQIDRVLTDRVQIDRVLTDRVQMFAFQNSRSVSRKMFTRRPYKAL